MESRFSGRLQRSSAWLIAGAFGALVGIVAPSCSSSNGRQIVGYKQPCTSQTDCDKYRLACNTTVSYCVECLSDSECTTGHCGSNWTCQLGSTGSGGASTGGSAGASTGGVGGVVTGCNPACGAGTVCDPSTVTCVQCLGDSDCSTGLTCVANICQAPQACTNSLDCTAGVCDQVSHQCVDCLGNNDCNAGESCVSEQCVPGGTGGSGGVATGGTGGTGGTTGGTGGTTGGTGGTTGGTGGTTGGTGGTTGGTGGTTGGTGGTSCVAGLIDNMDSGLNGAIPQCEGRIGGWFTYHDAYSTQTPAPASGYTFPYVTGGSDGGYAVRTNGTTTSSSCYDAYGAGMGVSIDDPGTGTLPYNASSHGFSGIRFYAKRGTTGTTSVQMHVRDRFTDPRGGYCVAYTNTCTTQGLGTTCYDDWYYTITLNTTWTLYSIPFSSLTRVGTWGLAYSFDASGIFSVQWQFGLGYTFDLYIDDLRFY